MVQYARQLRILSGGRRASYRLLITGVSPQQSLRFHRRTACSVLFEPRSKFALVSPKSRNPFTTILLAAGVVELTCVTPPPPVACSVKLPPVDSVASTNLVPEPARACRQ